MNLPTHGHLKDFDISDNCLCVGRRNVLDIVAESGRTPIYVYDAERIDRRIRTMRRTLPAAIKIHYAVKANPMPDVVQYVSRRTDGLDVASAGELELAMDTGVARRNISFAGPGKTDHELQAAVSAGVVINVESPNELTRLDRIASEFGTTVYVAIRVNPDFELKSSGMKMSGGAKPFGIDAETVPMVIEERLTPRLKFCGFHIFSGSQNLSADSICDAQTKSFQLAHDLSTATGLQPEFINLGGGIGIPYFPGDEPVDLSRIAENLHTLSEQADSQLPGVELVLELGRFIVGEAGLYICEVVDRKVSRGTTFLVTNGGLHHHLAASGNFGQVIRKDYPMVIGNRVLGTEMLEATVVGPLCTPLDVLSQRARIPAETDIGDLVVLFQSGAYGLSASPTAFLSHPPPVELFLDAHS